MELSVSTTLSFGVIECYLCGVRFALPLQMKKNLQENHKDFYCPNGHKQAFCGETEAQKLQRELKRKEQELADTVTAKLKAQSDLEAANKKLTRISNGVCPCCNRSFKDLAAHMKNKHPNFKSK